MPVGGDGTGPPSVNMAWAGRQGDVGLRRVPRRGERGGLICPEGGGSPGHVQQGSMRDWPVTPMPMRSRVTGDAKLPG